MLATPFLTLLDPRAKIKGSRDPLGLQPLWTRFGRQVIRNLTTVTTSTREFTVLLLGLFFAEQAVEAGDVEGESHLVECFLKFEQVAAYSRYAWRDKTGDNELGIRGIQRVKNRLNTSGGRVRISTEAESQILSNQKTYGLWGLYTVAARNSSWVEPDTPRLTLVARDFIESQYLPRLEHKGDTLFPFLKADRDFEPRGRDARLSQRLAELLGPQLTPKEKSFYTCHLIGAGEEAGPQSVLWGQIRAVNCKKPFRPTEDFSMLELRELIKHCRAQKDSVQELLATRLEHILQVETVIAPAELLFGLALARDSQTLTSIARETTSAWGRRLAHLNPQAFTEALTVLDEGIPLEARTRLIHVAEALATGDYRHALKLLIEQNLAVMQDRGGNAWVRLVHHEQVDTRFRDQMAGDLPLRDKVPDLWMNSYFLNALKQIGFQVEK